MEDRFLRAMGKVARVWQRGGLHVTFPRTFLGQSGDGMGFRDRQSPRK